MLIEFNNELIEKTIAFCNDELEYHLKDSGCANEYHNENLAEIEILSLIGEKENALEYANWYLKNSRNDSYVTVKLNKTEKKEIENLITKIKK